MPNLTGVLEATGHDPKVTTQTGLLHGINVQETIGLSPDSACTDIFALSRRRGNGPEDYCGLMIGWVFVGVWAALRVARFRLPTRPTRCVARWAAPGLGPRGPHD